MKHQNNPWWDKSRPSTDASTTKEATTPLLQREVSVLPLTEHLRGAKLDRQPTYLAHVVVVLTSTRKIKSVVTCMTDSSHAGVEEDTRDKLKQTQR